MTQSFSCVIPAHDEADRIADVLRAVVGNPALARVLVVDDGSRDHTARVARQAGAEVLILPRNRGKSGALAQGLAQVTSSHVLLLDADLIGLTAADVQALLAPVVTGRADVALSLRGNAPWLWRKLGVDYITGERVIPLDLLRPRLSDLPRLPRFGFEVYLNDVIQRQGMRTAVVPWPGVASPAKRRKRGLLAGLRADAAMMTDILNTVPASQALRQIASFARSARVSN